MDRRCSITISDLRIYARHGVGPQERAVGNEFALDIRLDYDATAAMRSDDVTDALNYADVISLVAEVMETPSCLLEHAVGRIHSTLLRRFPQITSGKITLRKLSPPISATLGSVAFTLRF